MINGVWLLRPALDFAVLCQRLQSKLLKHARFRQKVVQDTVPQKIIDRFAQEFEPLLSLTLMLSWAFDDDLRGPSRAFASTPALTR